MNEPYEEWLANSEKQAALLRAIDNTIKDALKANSNDVRRKMLTAREITQAAIAVHETRDTGFSPACAPNLTGDIRCSTEDRMRYQEHLAAMYAEGRLSQAEWELRHDKCNSALTEHEMKLLVSDLPKMSPPVRDAVVPASPARSFLKSDAVALAMCMAGVAVTDVSQLPAVVQDAGAIATFLAMLSVIVTRGIRKGPDGSGRGSKGSR